MSDLTEHAEECRSYFKAARCGHFLDALTFLEADHSLPSTTIIDEVDSIWRDSCQVERVGMIILAFATAPGDDWLP